MDFKLSKERGLEGIASLDELSGFVGGIGVNEPIYESPKDKGVFFRLEGLEGWGTVRSGWLGPEFVQVALPVEGRHPEAL